MRTIGRDFGDTARKVYAVASGALGNGKTCVVNTDGTVSVVGGATTSLGSEVIYESGATSWNNIVYDTSNDKVVIAYQDAGNSYKGKAVVGTISGSSISFGSITGFSGTNQAEVYGIVFDSSNNKVVISYKDGSDSDYGKAIVGTVSGTSISFGTAVTYNSSSSSSGKVSFDSSNNKVLIHYSEGSSAYGIVGTVSGTGISFGSEVQIINEQVTFEAQVFDSNANKTLVVYRRGDNNTSLNAKVATISGTSVSYGSEAELGQSGTVTAINNANDACFDPDNNKIAVFYSDKGNSAYGTVQVGTISGTSVSFGTAVVYNSADTPRVGVSYDTANNVIVVAYEIVNNGNGRVRTAAISGTSITFNDDSILFQSSNGVDWLKSVYDPDQGKTVLVYRNEAQSNKGVAKVYTVGFTNLTSENFIGITPSAYPDGAGAEIQTKGAVNEEQSGLTAGQSYFVQTDGTLGTTAGDPSVFAGTAVSATKIIVKG